LRLTVAGLGLVSVIAAAGCTSGDRADVLSENASRWRAGSAVVVLSADLAPTVGGQPLVIGDFGARRGVISVSGDTRVLKIALSRQATLADFAALRLELERTPGVMNVREVVIPPTR
jgi:hypothetical protein